jgi:TonB-linked SusC/RagA family outer membrane protein
MKTLYLTYTRRLLALFRHLSTGFILTSFCVGILVAPLSSFGAKQRDPVITLELKDASIKEALREIERQTRYNFVINENRIKAVLKTITISIKEESIVSVLDQILKGTDITYKIRKNHITLIPPSHQQSAIISLGDSNGPYFAMSNDSDRTLEDYLENTPAFIVNGTVKDDKNIGIPGVNVLVKGTSSGTVTDSKGDFSLEVPSSESVLIFSFIGYVSQEVPVNGMTTLNIQMKSDTRTLSEVVIVGYGTQRKSDLTGSVGSVKAEEIQERQLPSVTQALAGRIAGVAVNVNSGRPGGQSNVRIRGSSSISTSNNPLYVVDGVIMPVGTQTDGSYALNNAIDNINPSDIERIEVLKDASATAIYGARGANGVILVTTKRGSTTGGKVTYDMQLSVPTIGPNRVKMLNAQEFLDVEQLGWDNMKIYDPNGWNQAGNGGIGTHSSGRQNPAAARAALGPSAGVYALFDANGNPLYDTDWLKESTQNKLSQNHQLSFTGGSPDNSYGVYLGYRDDNGLLLNSFLKRYSARFVMDSKIKSWLSVGGSLSYNNQQENIVDFGTGGLNSVRMITEALPILPVRYPDGSFSHNKNYSPSIEGGQNPVDQMTNNTYGVLSRTTLANVYTNIKLMEGLEFRSTVGANILERERNRYNGRPALETPTYVHPATARGTARLQSDRETFWSFENYLTYNKKLANIHSFNAVLGTSIQETNMFMFQASARTFVSDFFQTNNIGSAQDFAMDSPPIRSNRGRFAFNSYFGRVNYGLMDKYFVTVTGRIDGSSKFGTASKYALFPSTALAYRLSEEPFLKNNRIISNLKLRASYGATGNSEIDAYSSLTTFRVVSNVVSNNRILGIATNRLGNPDLQWEKTVQSDVGIEVGLLNDRVTLEADLYLRKTTDMLLAAPLPVTSGYGSIVRNVGSMQNKGLELTLNTENISNGDFSWRTTFNVAMNRNKILKLANPAPIFGVGNPNFTNQTGVIMEGQPVGSFWGLVRIGTWSTEEADQAAQFGVNTYRGSNKKLLPGDVKYLDVNGDNAINDADRMIIGNGNPDAYGSIINNVRYKSFDFTLDLQYSYGNDVLNMTMHSGEDRTGLANSYRSVLDAWTPENQNTDIAAVRDARAGYVSNVDTRWLEDGSFLRGRNAIIGYNLPGALSERIHLSRVRISGSVQNFFLATKFSGNDPEVSTYTNPFAQGQTFFDYPKPTTYMLGISVGL